MSAVRRPHEHLRTNARYGLIQGQGQRGVTTRVAQRGKPQPTTIWSAAALGCGGRIFAGGQDFPMIVVTAAPAVLFRIFATIAEPAVSFMEAGGPIRHGF